MCPGASGIARRAVRRARPDEAGRELVHVGGAEHDAARALRDAARPLPIRSPRSGAYAGHPAAVGRPATAMLSFTSAGMPEERSPAGASAASHSPHASRHVGSSTSAITTAGSSSASATPRTRRRGRRWPRRLSSPAPPGSGPRAPARLHRSAPRATRPGDGRARPTPRSSSPRRPRRRRPTRPGRRVSTSSRHTVPCTGAATALSPGASAGSASTARRLAVRHSRIPRRRARFQRARSSANARSRCVRNASISRGMVRRGTRGVRRSGTRSARSSIAPAPVLDRVAPSRSSSSRDRMEAQLVEEAQQPRPAGFEARRRMPAVPHLHGAPDELVAAGTLHPVDAQVRAADADRVLRRPGARRVVLRGHQPVARIDRCGHRRAEVHVAETEHEVASRRTRCGARRRRSRAR